MSIARRRGAWRSILLAAASVAVLGAAPPSGRRARGAAVPHDLHITNTRMVIEGAVVVARVRMFRDDLQKALKRTVTDSAASKSAVAAYLTQNVLLTAEGVKLNGEVLDSGGDVDGDQPIWWALMQWKAPKPVTTLGVRVHLMFDAFADQQNTVLVARQPGDERRGLYFQAGDRAEQVLKF